MMKTFKQILILCCSFLLVLSCSKDDNIETIDILIDADGNTYKTIKIGNQTWMAENLKTTKYNDGSPITEYDFNTHDWLNLNTPLALYQWVDTSDLNNLYPNTTLPIDFYGVLYNHLAIESGKLAPKGYRIPTVQDFKELETYLKNNGYANIEAEALKSIDGWFTASGNGTNSVGFNGLASGYASAFGTSTFVGGSASWATTNYNASTQKRTAMSLFDTKTIKYDENAIQIGLTIRCIKE